MTRLFLRRFQQNDRGTFGGLFDDEHLYNRIMYTCERPDNGNEPMGCIPEGIYTVRPYNSPTKGHVFLLFDVPDRSMIEIHKGNTIKDTEGCILPGMAMGMIGDLTAVTKSGEAMALLLTRFQAGFDLVIDDVA